MNGDVPVINKAMGFEGVRRSGCIHPNIVDFDAN
jgi:hypothetical protein